jgi:cellulose synthase/poly-beta-1,6-N-acetylglucosamine synthase-like glycosyltransferase
VSEAIAIAVFWFSVAGLFFTYLGYPLVMTLLAPLRRADSGSVQAPRESWPSVSVVLVARNEAARIAARLQNLAASDYPMDRIEFIVVSDGSTDGTERIVESLGDAWARAIVFPEQRGKAAGLNAGVAAAQGEVIVFADARQSFATDTIRELIAAFESPALGAVSGELEIASSDGGVGGGIDLYWRLEKRLRQAEAAVDSSIGCTGAVYAIRRSLFTPIPGDTILDDVVIPMQIAMRGARVGFSAKARAFDPQALDPALETRRKRRTLAGNFQMLFRYPGWLLPWKNRLWWQLIAHKYLRLVAPVFLVAAAAANLALLASPFYRVVGALQLAFYTFALLGLVVRARIFSVPAGFVFLNYNVLRGFALYLAGNASSGWGATKGK